MNGKTVNAKRKLSLYCPNLITFTDQLKDTNNFQKNQDTDKIYSIQNEKFMVNLSTGDVRFRRFFHLMTKTTSSLIVEVLQMSKTPKPRDLDENIN